MTFAYNTYVSDGVNRLLPLPFGYIKPEHVVLRLNGAVSAARTLPATGGLLMDAAPPSGTLIEVLRSTPKADAMARVSDTSAVTGSDLNLNARQALYCIQEAADLAERGLVASSVPDLGYNVLGWVVHGAGEPQAPSDLATKGYTDATAARVLSAVSTAPVVSTPGGTPQTLAQRFAGELTAHDFGALGDGTGDDTAAILAGLAALPASGGTLRLRPGIYNVSRTIPLGNGSAAAGGSHLERC